MIDVTPSMKKFITHWGEMGTKWGINRSVAQIHALLYLSQGPLSAEEISSLLKVARSNVSNSIRELLNWGIIKTVHELGDRRDQYETMKDVYEMFRIILEERKKREIDPTMQVLRTCLEDVHNDKKDTKYTRERLEAFSEFFETATQWYDRIKNMPLNKIVDFMRLEKKIKNTLKK